MNGLEHVERRPALPDSRAQVERVADRIRDGLLLTLEELERRGRRAVDVRHQVRRLKQPRLLALVGGSLVLLAGLGTGLVLLNRSRRHTRQRARLWTRRRRAVSLAWQHPERLATRAPMRPLSRVLGERLVLTFSTALATALSHRMLAALEPPRRALE